MIRLSCTGTPCHGAVGNRGRCDDRHGGRAWIDEDLRAHDDVAEVERAGDRGRDDRQAERRALVGAGEVDLPGQRDRFAAEARRPRSSGRSGCPGRTVACRLRFRARRDRGEHRGHAGRQVHVTALSGWSASGRSIVSVKGENAPACRLCEPAAKAGANGSGFAQRLPPGPEVDVERARVGRGQLASVPTRA